uniref:Kinesin motor domain-containing protein n=1 Tax=Chromera velia CCMP2878 TaxID=1169474 RepID=A0A0G4HEF5_9ALVE|eukprot:Cvel_26747.t1-p1 / transcript=Cvel_26747.t1 / gene=Cvel_26747 / organism=Chromera_velia_CCMP2878 / gene_product=hypothetical protein / transcript_product=hypothetical protein / location=Cvel_scaffold3230:4133-14344(+) / protein_length=1840 / sequence_SO=supercontig / SO=protein_coding / is_pseudo=false
MDLIVKENGALAAKARAEGGEAERLSLVITWCALASPSPKTSGGAGGGVDRDRERMGGRGEEGGILVDILAGLRDEDPRSRAERNRGLRLRERDPATVAADSRGAFVDVEGLTEVVVDSCDGLVEMLHAARAKEGDSMHAHHQFWDARVLKETVSSGCGLDDSEDVTSSLLFGSLRVAAIGHGRNFRPPPALPPWWELEGVVSHVREKTRASGKGKAATPFPLPLDGNFLGQLLKASLVGSCRTLLVVTASPLWAHVGQTHAALTFGRQLREAVDAVREALRGLSGQERKTALAFQQSPIVKGKWGREKEKDAPSRRPTPPPASRERERSNIPAQSANAPRGSPAAAAAAGRDKGSPSVSTAQTGNQKEVRRKTAGVQGQVSSVESLQGSVGGGITTGSAGTEEGQQILAILPSASGQGSASARNTKEADGDSAAVEKAVIRRDLDGVRKGGETGGDPRGLSSSSGPSGGSASQTEKEKEKGVSGPKVSACAQRYGDLFRRFGAGPGGSGPSPSDLASLAGALLEEEGRGGGKPRPLLDALEGGMGVSSDRWEAGERERQKSQTNGEVRELKQQLAKTQKELHGYRQYRDCVEAALRKVTNQRNQLQAEVQRLHKEVKEKGEAIRRNSRGTDERSRALIKARQQWEGKLKNVRKHKDDVIRKLELKLNHQEEAHKKELLDAKAQLEDAERAGPSVASLQLHLRESRERSDRLEQRLRQEENESERLRSRLAALTDANFHPSMHALIPHQQQHQNALCWPASASLLNEPEPTPHAPRVQRDRPDLYGRPQRASSASSSPPMPPPAHGRSSSSSAASLPPFPPGSAHPHPHNTHATSHASGEQPGRRGGAKRQTLDNRGATAGGGRKRRLRRSQSLSLSPKSRHAQQPAPPPASSGASLLPRRYRLSMQKGGRLPSQPPKSTHDHAHRQGGTMPHQHQQSYTTLSLPSAGVTPDEGSSNTHWRGRPANPSRGSPHRKGLHSSSVKDLSPPPRVGIQKDALTPSRKNTATTAALRSDSPSRNPFAPPGRSPGPSHALQTLPHSNHSMICSRNNAHQQPPPPQPSSLTPIRVPHVNSSTGPVSVSARTEDRDGQSNEEGSFRRGAPPPSQLERRFEEPLSLDAVAAGWEQDADTRLGRFGVHSRDGGGDGVPGASVWGDRVSRLQPALDILTQHQQGEGPSHHGRTLRKPSTCVWEEEEGAEREQGNEPASDVYEGQEERDRSKNRKKEKDSIRSPNPHRRSVDLPGQGFASNFHFAPPPFGTPPPARTLSDFTGLPEEEEEEDPSVVVGGGREEEDPLRMVLKTSGVTDHSLRQPRQQRDLRTDPRRAGVGRAEEEQETQGRELQGAITVDEGLYERESNQEVFPLSPQKESPFPYPYPFSNNRPPVVPFSDAQRNGERREGVRGGEATTPPLLQRRDDRIRSPEWEDRLKSRVTFCKTPPLPAASIPPRSLEHERIGGGGQRGRQSGSVARRLPSTSSSVLQMQGGGFEPAYEDDDNDDTMTVEQVQLPRARENARENPGMPPSSQQNTHGGMPGPLLHRRSQKGRLSSAGGRSAVSIRLIRSLEGGRQEHEERSLRASERESEEEESERTDRVYGGFGGREREGSRSFETASAGEGEGEGFFFGDERSARDQPGVNENDEAERESIHIQIADGLEEDEGGKHKDVSPEYPAGSFANLIGRGRDHGASSASAASRSPFTNMKARHQAFQATEGNAPFNQVTSQRSASNFETSTRNEEDPSAPSGGRNLFGSPSRSPDRLCRPSRNFNTSQGGGAEEPTAPLSPPSKVNRDLNESHSPGGEEKDSGGADRGGPALVALAIERFLQKEKEQGQGRRAAAAALRT